MNNDILRKLQVTEFEILKEAVKICKKYNLKYYLIGGTLLGAVRHSGFIPWDDDLDIGLPREDYNRFLTLCEKELPSPYHIHSINTDANYYLRFSKIKKRGTVFAEHAIRNVKTQNEVFIDIFPLDFSDKKDTMFRKYKVLLLHFLSWMQITKAKVDRPGFIKQILRIILYPFYKPISMEVYDKLCTSLMTADNHKVHNFIINYASNYNYKKQTMPIKIYEPYSKISFENELFCVPGQYIKYLENLFGNWKELPPIEKRRTHLPDDIQL